MKRAFAVLLTMALVLSAGAAMAALTWDFNDGMQGWTITNTGTATGQWVGSAPFTLATDTNGNPIYSGAGVGNVYLPGDSNGSSYATLNLNGIVRGGKTSSFVFAADVWIPNLRPLNFRYNYPGMLNQNSGLFVQGLGTNGLSNDWPIAIGGNLAQGSEYYLDYTSDDWTKHEKSWCMEDSTMSDPYDNMWNCWIRLKLDYNFSQAGVVTASALIPFPNYVGGANEWVTLYSGPIESSSWMPRPLEVNRINLGAWNKGGATPWTKSQFDNVTFDSPDLVPEPGSFAALGAGLIGLVGFVRRRKA